MENPLTEEQIQKLNEISRLSPERQKEELGEYLRTLRPEQIEFLKKQQNAEVQCPFCLMIDGKISYHKVYEDNNFLGVLDINPATKGHAILFPKHHYKSLDEIKNTAELFNAANKIAGTLLKIGAEGINIFIANGTVAGQTIPHLLVHIIPRYSGDNVSFSWKSIKIDDEEMKVIAAKIEKNMPVNIDKAMKITESETRKIFYREKERVAKG